ncbi:MAG TPA: sigma 54-interacting transcriptional regulator [Polyangiaceae bacterium]|mgnify:CR=1 FL=1|nr:sigma 54-interacting transcriptional regulator [Polyangiaceae bacterium]
MQTAYSTERTSDAIPAQPAAEPCGLARLDERVISGHRGVLVVDTTDASTAHAVRQHVVRRARRLVGRVVLTADAAYLFGCLSDLALRLGIPKLSTNPQVASRQLGEASQGTVVVIEGNVAEGSWDAQVLRFLANNPCLGLFLVIRFGDRNDVLQDEGERVQIVGESKESARVWWEGVIEALVEAGPPGSLASLERWWRGMGGLATWGNASPSVLSEAAQTLLLALQLAHRSWPLTHIDLLGGRQGLEELRQGGLVRIEQGYCVLERAGRAMAKPHPETLRGVALAMLEVFMDDAWARLRVALLLLEGQAEEQVQEHLARAMVLAGAASQRRDLWRIWCHRLAQGDADKHREISLWSARRALALDDVDAALELAGEARRGLVDPPFEAWLLMGRAQLARGDMVGARVSLEKARQAAVDTSSEARALASEAEVLFWAGELEQAEAFAQRACSMTERASTRLRARNVLGRILLARAKWQQAEESFAEDEALAASERLPDALARARVNRAVAWLSAGQLDVASRVLEAEHQQAQRHALPRANAIALSNLGVIAHIKGRYAHALELYEQAIEACQELGDRLVLARPAINLAELRLELGLVDEAEQALRFAQCTLRAGVPASIAPLISVLEAEIGLERGHTSEAARHAQEALRNAACSSNGGKIGECHRLMAKIALEEGNTNAARQALVQSQQHIDGARAQAEHAWLEARLARAAGHDATELARNASSLARACGEPEVCRACAVLEAEIAFAQGDIHAAREYLRLARRAFHAMTEGLTPALLRSVRTRKDVRAMDALALEMDRQNTAREESERQDAPSTSGFVGSDPKVRRLMEMVRRVAIGSNAPVLIRGESGTGKELIAEAIHQHSDRRHKPLVKVNCAALVETLLLSELFGHEKGSFTGAATRRKGRFELAEGGILFLDEIGDISPRTQVALLRVLQDGTFERVGGGTPLHADVRVVCATHRDLAAMVAEGTFREDLYYRLCGVVIEGPSLRERKRDIHELSNTFLQQIAREQSESVKSLTEEALEILVQHPWPGNVRELQNVLRAASLFADGSIIDAACLFDQIRTPMQEPLEPVPRSGTYKTLVSTQDPVDLAFDSIRHGDTSLTEMKRRIERECIVRALEETGGNITRAASLLGMKRPRLSQIIKELGLQKGEG